MKEAFNLLQTYEIFLKIMYISLLKEYKDNLGKVIKTENWIKDNEWTSKETWYDGEGKELCSKDENGNKTSVLYNELGLVSSITYPNGLGEERSYDKDGILKGIERKQGNKVLYKELYELDGLGRITEKRIPTGENSKVVLEKYTYDNRGNVTEESLSYEGDTTDDVRTIKKVYDYESRIISQEDGEKNTTKNSYDAKGNLLTVEDPRQKNENYTGEFYMQMEYDAFGRVVKGWTPHTVKRATLTDANVDVIIEYDAMGNVVKRTDKADDSSSVITTYTYSKAGRLQEEQTDGYTTKYEYDEAGRQTEITAPDGVKTYKKYDGSGRLIEEQTGNTNAKTKYVYNPTGTLKTFIDRNGNKTEYEYDCMNQLTKESVSGLLEKTYTYDSLGRKVSENDKENNLREYNYDNLGRVIKEITPEGIELSYTYDARGNVTEYIDGRKTKFVRKYTKTDLLSSEKAFAVKENNDYEAEPAVTRSYKYDEGGILEEITEKIKNQEEESKLTYNEKGGSYQSDAYGNIRSMKWSSTGFEMNYEYDNLNRMTNVITPDRKKVDYTYNMNNQVTSLTGYINESITYSKAKISEYTLLNGIKKSFEYNDLGLTSSLKYNKDESIKTGFSYTYDDNLNIETRTSLDTKKLSSFEYDDANRLTNSYMEGEFESKTAEHLTTDNFTYINRDLVGAKQELVKYEVLPEIIFDTSARSYVYKFSGTKEIRAIELYPKSKVHRVRERDVHIYVKKSSEGSWQEVRNWKFNKDEKNGKLSFVFKEAVSAGYVKVRSSWDDRDKENKSIDDYSTFKGNANNLLRIWTLENTLTEGYSYDGNSNRIRKAENGTASSYEYYKNTQGGNTAKVRFDGKWYYTYDENGNRTSRAKALISGVADKNKEYWTYEWDLWNRLVKVVQYNAPDEGECVEVSYEYDVLNHRISRTTDSETTKYAYGRNGALAYQEKTVDGSVTKRSFTYLNNEIIGFTDKVGEEEAVYYTVTDIQGSITEVYDGSSNLVWKSGYTAFGEIAGETVDLIDFDGMYTGCDYDSATGLTYHWNRWRSEDGSCFISEDPARDGSNWYGYAGQNPMVYVDRIGLFYYTAEGQQSSTSNAPKTDKNDNSNKTPQNQSPNKTGQGPTGVPKDVSPSPNITSENLLGQERESNYDIENPYIVTGELMGEQTSFVATIVITLGKEKTKRYAATKGELTVYLGSWMDYKYDSLGENVLTVPIVSGGTDKNGNIYAPVSKGKYNNLDSQKAHIETNNDILKDSNHGGPNNEIIRLYSDYLIHQANNQIPQEGAYTEGCVGITAYNLNRDSVTGKTDVDKNYQAFKDAIYKAGVINVIIQ